MPLSFAVTLLAHGETQSTGFYPSGRVSHDGQGGMWMKPTTTDSGARDFPMHFETPKQTLLVPLQLIASIVERKQTLPILANALLRVTGDNLHLTGTDSELELSYCMPLEGAPATEGAITVPAQKLCDICRSLAEGAQIQFNQEDNRAIVKAGRSRFVLSCLPAEDFPVSEATQQQLEFSLPQRVLKFLLAKTQFAMAQQDVRYYLNGLLLDMQPKQLNVVATDGHRLALAAHEFTSPSEAPLQVILPRKTVSELAKILEDSDEPVSISIGHGYIRFALPALTLTSKLIDGRYPDYYGVLPANPDKILTVECAPFKQALRRMVILSNEKYKGVRLLVNDNSLTLNSHNPEQEEAEEELDVSYQGESLEIGFNITYLLDALGVIDTDTAELLFTNTNNSCLLRPLGSEVVKYVIMPMRL